MRTEVVLGSTNEGKVRELRALMADLPIDIVGLSEFPGLPDVPETGDTFAENAALKAASFARLTGRWALADDSGLAVDSLGGRPGVLSARFAGEAATDAQNIEKLLLQMENLGDGNRRACFVCEMALADPKGRIRFTATGTCDGRITRKPFGHNGFGYDPIFVPAGFSETFGQISDDEKNRISHRTVAARKIKGFFKNPDWNRT